MMPPFSELTDWLSLSLGNYEWGVRVQFGMVPPSGNQWVRTQITNPAANAEISLTEAELWKKKSANDDSYQGFANSLTGGTKVLSKVWYDERSGARVDRLNVSVTNLRR